MPHSVVAVHINLIGSRPSASATKQYNLVPAVSLYHNNCDSTTIRLQYDDATTHSTTTEVCVYTTAPLKLRPNGAIQIYYF